jgi:hypothetical protein
MMRLRLFKKLLPFILIATFNCCQSDHVEENMIVLDINPDKAEKLSMDKWFEKIELIPLETNPESIMASTRKTIYLDGKLYIWDGKQNAIFIFDENGRFLFNTIHLSGRGPNEYGGIGEFFINPRTKQIEILDPSLYRIMIYDLQGNYVNTDGIFNRFVTVFANRARHVSGELSLGRETEAI